MRHITAVGLKWFGRLLLLGVPYVIVCSLFFPAGVQFLNPVVCPDGLELDNHRYTPPNRPDDARLEVVCTSPDYSASAGREVLLTIAAMATIGLISMYFSKSLDKAQYRRPTGPGAR